ncbi:MAG: 16S rRNA (cytosine(1402)-N(4))-methyltransferase RsmH [Myxococcota bacterium]
MSESGVAHISVLADEVCAALGPCLGGQAPARVLVDATAGLGGHTKALLEATTPTQAILFDRDPHALAQARARLQGAACPLHFVHAGFATLLESLAELGLERVTGIVADLGVSSMQLDQAERGFSFRGDGPLDMRMDPTRGQSAAELIASCDLEQLTRILREFGEQPEPRRIAAAILEARPTTTRELAKAVTEATSHRERRKLGVRIHPATRAFQALRIEVNDELGQLDRFLEDAPSCLEVGGRVAVITFHSLEDRRVKRRWRALSRPPQPPPHLPLTADELPQARFAIPAEFSGGVRPSSQETEANPRARSARLRVLERCAP